MKLQYAFKLTGITDVMNYSKKLLVVLPFEFVMKSIFENVFNLMLSPPL